MEKKSCCVLCFTLVCKCLRKVGRFIFKGSLKPCIHLSKKLGNCEIFIGKHFAIVSIVMVNKKKRKLIIVFLEKPMCVLQGTQTLQSVPVLILIMYLCYEKLSCNKHFIMGISLKLYSSLT